MIIRAATLDDAMCIAKVHVDCWRTTYKNCLPSEFLDKLSYNHKTESWIKNISDNDHYVFVAENSEGKIVGFADGGKRYTNKIKCSGDLTSIYLLKKYQKMGVGKMLVNKLFETFNRLGYKTIFVEVLEDNDSRFFYEALGAQLLESKKINIAGVELNLLIYRWEDIRTVFFHLKQ
ncbi:GNAT family N-acetyltransferase [Psychrobacillus sp. NPDC058041]|uniref:GNAT family N-acetyltransferase n=1 Tax=Psychrobacillus sp. NPDC058041 TaxID=3346310 RepID=UPI0036DABC83